jgi:glycosyltransferase involved in cell wall biosynthesis
MLPDAVISLGNKLVKSTYEIFFKGPVYPLNPPVYILQNYKEIVSSKDFSNASKNFLWFGSSGLIHKGLDVLLDLFSLRDDIHLHICGPVDDEPEFKELYYRALYKLPNIHTYGFISLDSGLFRELLKKCAFVIAPSCSEGGSAGILNLCANGGLIPIVSTESGIDVDEFGFMLTTISVKEIQEIIDKLITFKPEELSKLSMKSGEIISHRNNAAKYSEDLSLILKEILK